MIGAGKTRSKQAVCQRISRRVVSGVEMILPVKIRKRKRKRKTLLRWRFRPIRYREEKPRKAWASRAGVLVLFGETRKQVGQGRFRKIRKSRKCRSELRPDLCRILQLHLLPGRAEPREPSLAGRPGEGTFPGFRRVLHPRLLLP